MGFQGAGSHEGVVANLAHVRPLVGVLPFVVSEMALGGEGTATSGELAPKRLLARMDPHVSF